MSSLNQKKTAKAACLGIIAPFSVVFSTQRGGLPPRIVVCLISLLLSSCAVVTTTKQRPTRATRNDAVVDSVIAQNFQAVQLPDAHKPELNIALEQQLGRTRQYQRRHIEKRRLKPAVRVTLWATGAAIAGGGYYLYDQTGRSRLGELAMGAGGLIPLGGGIITASLPPVGEQWKDESWVLPMETRPAPRVPLRVATGDSTWTKATNSQGMITVDISKFADEVALGKPLRVTVALVEDLKQKASFVVPADVVNHHRTPPEIQFTSPSSSGAEGVSPVSIPVVLSSVSGLIAAVDYSVTGGTSEGEGMDYFLKAGRLTIPAGDTSATIDILITDDDAVEGDESILVSLSRPMNATLGGNTMHTHIIIDNDETRPVTVISAGNIATIAILDFQGIGVSAQEAMVLTNRLATKMVALGAYQVIERGQMEQILQEQDFQLTGCTTSECAVEIGQLIGAQQMLAGSFGKLGTVYTIDMKIIDVETGRILHTTSYDIEGSINLLLTEGLEEAVRRITNTD